MEPFLKAHGLFKSYEGPPPVEVLKDCSLEVYPGEYVAITGASGSGKTTLLSLLGLLEEPTRGEYALLGHDTSELSEPHRSRLLRDHIGFVFQSFHLLLHRTVTENIELALRYQGVARVDRRTRVAEALQQVGLDHRAEAPCKNLSGGEKQRVAIARALVKRPSLLLCDEPTGNLDSKTSTAILAVLKELQAGIGFALLMVTHDDEIARAASRQMRVEDGTIVERYPTVDRKERA